MVDDIHVVWDLPNYASAYDACKKRSTAHVDNAHMPVSLIAQLHRLRDEEAAASSTEELG